MQLRLRSKCIWCDDCDGCKNSNVFCVCENYEPIDSLELAAEQYRKDLNIRASVYQERLDELNMEEY